MGTMRNLLEFYTEDEINPEYPSIAGILEVQDTYLCIEYFCDNPCCACREILVYFFSIAKASKKPSSDVVAVFTYYLKKHNSPTLVKDFKKSKLTDGLLKKLQAMLREQSYIDRLKNHYHLVKERVSECAEHAVSNKIGRNELCPCGSGKKYKKCCASLL